MRRAVSASPGVKSAEFIQSVRSPPQSSAILPLELARSSRIRERATSMPRVRPAFGVGNRISRSTFARSMARRTASADAVSCALSGSR